MKVLLSVEDIEEGGAKGIEFEHHFLFAVKKDDQVYLYRNSCPHLGTPLEWEEDRFLDADGALIQCSTHGALFRIEDGHCLAGPCRGKYLQAVPYTLNGNLIMVDDKHLPPPPSF